MKPAAVGPPPVHRYIRTGLGVCVFGLGSFVLWAALAPLTSAAMAPGVVKASSHVKTVQHYDGGIVSEILVRDGDHVAENQLLMRLQGTEFAADYDALDQRMIDFETQEARPARSSGCHHPAETHRDALERSQGRCRPCRTAADLCRSGGDSGQAGRCLALPHRAISHADRGDRAAEPVARASDRTHEHRAEGRGIVAGQGL
jgi:pyruvate/2-oxoglutarate dehydrogenase complex dihydrolipoamide acyltransferase (E2) component